MKKLIALCAMGLVAGSAAAAGEGFYLEAGVGAAKADLPSASGFSKDDKDTAFSLGAGYRFNQYIAAEAGYQHLGEASYSGNGNATGNINGTSYNLNGSVRISAEDTKGWYLGPKLSLPVGNGFELNARAGVFVWESRLKASATLGGTVGGQAIAAGGSSSRKYDGTDVYWGVGAAYNINKNIAVGLDYTRFKLDDYDVDTWSLKGKYSF